MRTFEITIGVPFIVTACEEGERAMYSLRLRDPGVSTPAGDAFYPHPAVGFLAFDGNVVTGVLKRAFFDRDAARELVWQLGERLLGDVQTVQTIDLVSSQFRIIESGEESTCLDIEGDEAGGFWRPR